MTEKQLYGLLDLYRRYQRTVTTERTPESKFEVYKTDSGFCVQIGHKTGVGSTMEKAVIALELALDSAIEKYVSTVLELARGEATDPGVVRFRFSFGGSGVKDIVGAVLGAGAFVVSLERLLFEQARAEREEPLMVHEPSQGCVLVYPDDGPPVAVHLNALEGYA